MSIIRHIFLLPSIYRKPFPSLRFSRFLSRRVTTPRRVWPACPRVQHLSGSRSCHRPRPRLGVSLALVRSSLLQCLSEIYHFLQHPFYLAHSDFYSVISFAAQGRALDLSEKSFYLFFFSKFSLHFAGVCFRRQTPLKTLPGSVVLLLFPNQNP